MATKKAAPKVAPKSAAAKKAAKNGKGEKAEKKAPATRDEARKALLDDVIAKAEEKYGPGCVVRAETAYSSYMLRRPTGIMSLDIAMAGGWPASAPSVLVGPEGAGKDYLLWRAMAEQQRLYGEDFCAAVYFTEFKMDKKYMRDMCGFMIAYSEEEIEELERARHAINQPSFAASELDYMRKQIGTFLPIYGISADHGFDEIFKLMRSNLCQIVAVNSIGFLQTEAKEQTDSYEEFAQQRNEAMLLTKAMPQFAMYMNQPDQWGRPNETSLILVNQVRSVDAQKRGMPGRPVQEKDKYKTAANAYALKHGKALELMIHNGPVLLDKTCDPPMSIGRRKQWEITKGKLGTHEGIRGEFDYFYGYGADIYGDLVNVASELGIIDVKGAWYSYSANGTSFNVQGGAKVLEKLREDPDLMHEIRMRCFQESGTLVRTK